MFRSVSKQSGESMKGLVSHEEKKRSYGGKDLQKRKVLKSKGVISGKSGPKDQVALHYYYTSPSHWCTTHEVSKL